MSSLAANMEKMDTEQASLISTSRLFQMHACLSVLGENEEQLAVDVWLSLLFYFYVVNMRTLVYLSVFTLPIRKEDSRRGLHHPD